MATIRRKEKKKSVIESFLHGKRTSRQLVREKKTGGGERDVANERAPAFFLK